MTTDKGLVNILRSEVTFWITIVCIIVSAVIAFTTLSGIVYAQGDKDTRLREEFDSFVIERRLALEEINKKLEIIIVNQANSQKDIEYIKQTLSE